MQSTSRFPLGLLHLLLLLQLTLFTSRVTTEVAFDEEQVFLQKIFNKYGDKQGFITFEGFEHLMENLGLGRLKFEKPHNMSMHRAEDGEFRELHDSLRLHIHNHSHPEPLDQAIANTSMPTPRRSISQRHRRSVPTPGAVAEAPPSMRCLTPGELLELYGLEPEHGVAISPTGFLRICPAIVYQLDTKTCAPLTPSLSEDQEPTLAPAVLAWAYGVGSILVISVAGLVCVGVVALVPSASERLGPTLSFLMALAVGTLTGDALLHLLPHALQAPGHTLPALRSSTTFLTLLAFFGLEAVIQYRHHAQETKKNVDAEYAMVPPKTGEGDHGHSHDSSSGLGWMIVAGDGLHNFTDGLAVGAAFRADLVAGFATALAVLTHELPHELGDFAALIKTGMTVSQGIKYNMVSSVLSLFGMMIGMGLGHFQSASYWIYAVTAGSFLYIALAGLVPELHKQRRSQQFFPCVLFQLGGIFLGASLMFLIAIYEEDLHSLFD